MATSAASDTGTDICEDDPNPLPIDTRTEKPIPERLLARLAHRVYPQHLYMFATTQLNIGDAKFFQITDGTQNNAWQRCHNVLLHWYRRHIHYGDLVRMLQKAEEFGFVERGTLADVQQGEVWKDSYLKRYVRSFSQNEVVAVLRAWYRHPDWQAMLLCPWLKMEETFRLSAVYTTLEMESVISRKVTPLKHYTDLFIGTNSSEIAQNKGCRILTQGIPGIGKTTFTHKVALDWADGQLGQFDFVFVAKLRDLKPDQTIPNAIMMQMTPDESIVNEGTINRYLTQSDESVLLILDGLDEIDLKKYNQVTRILSGEDYPTCCVMATSRPHISPAIKRQMTFIANITGFSKKSAEEYVSHIIPNDESRNLFFNQLIERKMQRMSEVPIILQALALLFTADKTLPDTYSLTYDDLVYYLQKTCESSKGLSSEQIAEAMNLVNELAFRGLTKELQQLVFPREEIIDENMFKLGILSGTNSVTGFVPTSSVQFTHKTVQEYSTAGHVTKNLKAGNRKPWERIKDMYNKAFVLAEDPSSQATGRQRGRETLKRQTSEMELPESAEENEKAIILNNASQKFIPALMKSKSSKQAAVKSMFKVVLDKGFLDDNPDIPSLWKAAQSFPATESFTEEERHVCFDYFVKDLMLTADKEQKRKLKERVHKMVHTNNNEAWKFAVVLQMLARWANKDPTRSMHLGSTVVHKLLSSGDTVSFQSGTTNEQWLQDQANSMKILFRFILGKLPPDLANQILGEIAEMLVEHAFDPSGGVVLSVYFLKQYISDLAAEAKLHNEQIINALYSTDTHGNVANSAPVPAIVHIKISTPLEMRPSNMTPNALALEQMSGSLDPIIQVIHSMRKLTVVEIQNTSASVLKTTDCMRFAEALGSSSSILSLFLNQIDDMTLCNAIIDGLPDSTQRLSVREVARSKTYHFPTTVNLQCLYIEESLSGVTHLFTSEFPRLKTLSIMSRFKWTVNDIRSLHAAVTEERMPFLQHLCVRFGDLSNHGKYLLEIVERSSMQTVDLMDTNLSKKDGQLLLAALEDGSLANIQSLNLLDNPGINSLVDDFLSVCNKLLMDIHCTKTSHTNTSQCFFALQVALQCIPRPRCRPSRSSEKKMAKSRSRIKPSCFKR